MENTTVLKIMEVKNGRMVKEKSMNKDVNSNHELEVKEIKSKPMKTILRPEVKKVKRVKKVAKDELKDIKKDDKTNVKKEKVKEKPSGANVSNQTFISVLPNYGAIRITVQYLMEDNKIHVSVNEYRVFDDNYNSGVVKLYVESHEGTTDFKSISGPTKNVLKVVEEHYGQIIENNTKEKEA